MVTIKGREYAPIAVKDSFNRRALQFRNTIVDRLKKLGITDDDIDVPMEAVALRKAPASVAWYVGGRHLYYSCNIHGKFAENLLLVSKVIETEVNALLAEETTFEDFCDKFKEDKDVEAARKEARAVLGLHEDEKDIDVINKTYKELAKEHHPDTDNGDVEKFKQINNAHKTLKRELT